MLEQEPSLYMHHLVMTPFHKNNINQHLNETYLKVPKKLNRSFSKLTQYASKPQAYHNCCLLWCRKTVREMNTNTMFAYQGIPCLLTKVQRHPELVSIQCTECLVWYLPNVSRECVQLLCSAPLRVQNCPPSNPIEIPPTLHCTRPPSCTTP